MRVGVTDHDKDGGGGSIYSTQILILSRQSKGGKEGALSMPFDTFVLSGLNWNLFLGY